MKFSLSLRAIFSFEKSWVVLVVMGSGSVLLSRDMLVFCCTVEGRSGVETLIAIIAELKMQ